MSVALRLLSIHPSESP